MLSFVFRGGNFVAKTCLLSFTTHGQSVGCSNLHGTKVVIRGLLTGRLSPGAGEKTHVKKRLK